MPGVGLLGSHVSRSADQADRPMTRGVRTQGNPARVLRSGGFFGLTDELGKTPIEDDHLTEASQDDVFRLQVPMDHTARVRIADGLAHRNEAA